MLDSPADVPLVGIRFERRLEDIECLAIGTIADRMHAELVTVLHGEFGGLLDRRHRRRVVAGGVGLIRIGFEQPRAARAERAVNRVLDPADGQETIPVVDHPVPGHVGRERGVTDAQHDPEPVLDLSLVHHHLHQVDVGE